MDQRFVSYAQTGEDVVLWRALGDVEGGRYVDVGAADPRELSVTHAFYERGWRGLNIEPAPDFAERLRTERPEDEVVQAVVTAQEVGTTAFHHVIDTGLSTLSDELAEQYATEGREIAQLTVPTVTLDAALKASELIAEDIHFLKVDVEGAEADVLESLDLARWRPWVLVVEATRPLSTEQSFSEWEDLVLKSDYQFCLFDGLNRFYVADEHADIAARLSYPACPLDDFVRADFVQALQRASAAEQGRAAAEQKLARTEDEAARRASESDSVWRDAVRWRNAALHNWAEAIASPHRETEVLRGEVQRLTAANSAFQERIQIWQEEGRKLRRELRTARERVKSLRGQLDDLNASVSWRVTRPLRTVRRAQLRASRGKRA